ncbi:MAG: BamA/TamA family outer membrane protein [Bacteroidales bacterium]
MIRFQNHRHCLILVCLVIGGCSSTSHLPGGDKLYKGAEVRVVSTEIRNTRKVRAIASDAVRDQPNQKFLGMRTGLWLYRTVGDEPDTRFGKWLKSKGEPPVVIGEISPDITAANIDANLFNAGYFHSLTVPEVVTKKRSAKVVYTSHVSKPYAIGSFTVAIPDTQIARLIHSVRHDAHVKPGKDFSLALLKIERERVDELLKNNGYFFFDPDYLLFKADSSGADHLVDLILTLKDSIPDDATRVYRINKVYIDQNYSLDDELAGSQPDTIRYAKNVISGPEKEMSIRLPVVLESVYLRKHKVYTRENHIVTLNRLMSLNSFKFVQVKFSGSDTAIEGFLDVTILLTPMTKRTVRFEMDLVSKSNNFMGPRLNISSLNRNVFGGAEHLTINLAGSFEIQLSGNSENLYTYSLQPQVDLTFPRFLVPFEVNRSNIIYAPRTTFLLSSHYVKRLAYFDMYHLQFSYGFSWKENIRKEHVIKPFNISFASVRNKSDQFKALLEGNPFLKKSYEEQFIAGMNYSFTYNEQVHPDKIAQSYLQLYGETAGNSLTLAHIIGGNRPTAEDPATILGSVYSQFFKVTLDGRFYYNLNPESKFAFRFFSGVARAYGNSSVLPYAIQFFSGGANSLRAFSINAVGPGTYHQEDFEVAGFLRLGGDIKLESNAEYRFTIYRMVKGAVFMDAGNVWLHKSNAAAPGSPFLFSGFMNELAVGAGLGIRLDVSFFILRFDLAFPLRKPWLEEDARWVVDEISFGNPSWRKENLRLNVAIGYPF